MANEEGAPTDLTDSWEATLDERPTRDRVYGVAVQLHDPTRVAEIAARADCAKETARDHLRWLAEAGIVEQDTQNPDTFSRNESYFRWKRIEQLRELPADQLTDRLDELTEQERRFSERYDADDPNEVDALDHVDYGDVDQVWMELDEWTTIRRRIRDLEEVRRNRGDEVYA